MGPAGQFAPEVGYLVDRGTPLTGGISRVTDASRTSSFARAHFPKKTKKVGSRNMLLPMLKGLF